MFYICKEVLLLFTIQQCWCKVLKSTYPSSISLGVTRVRWHWHPMHLWQRRWWCVAGGGSGSCHLGKNAWDSQPIQQFEVSMTSQWSHKNHGEITVWAHSDITVTSQWWPHPDLTQCPHTVLTLWYQNQLTHHNLTQSFAIYLYYHSLITLVSCVISNELCPKSNFPGW